MTPPHPGGAVRLTGISKSYGSTTAVHPLDLTVPEGRFFALLGASGCGKTTTLRMIAGLERPTTGTVHLGDRDITDLPPYKRPVNTVFQSYALFPHLDVYENVAFGLRRRGVRSVRKQVAEMLDLVQLGPYARRRPRELSGGQQQRVAVARALINHPRVLLLDEPLGALDLKLRRRMQLELKRIQTEVGITFIHVTHDQEEAMAMADTVAVMNGGRVEQLGAPAELYDLPRTAFVANFLGTSNLIEAEVTGVSGADVLVTAGGTRLALPARRCPGGPDAGGTGTAARATGSGGGAADTGRTAGGAGGAAGAGTGGAGAGAAGRMPRAGERILLGVRPEKISLTPADDAHTVGDGRNRLTGRISDSSFIGVSTQYLVAGPAGTTLSVYEQNIERDPRLVPGAEVVLHWNPAHGFGLRADRSPAAGAGPDEPPAGGPGSERPAAGARPGPSPEDGTPAGPSRAGGTGAGPSPATAAGPGQGAP